MSVRGVLHLRKESRWSELQFRQRWDSQWTMENVNTRRPRFGLTFSAPWLCSRKTRMHTLQTGWKVEHQWKSRETFFLEGILPLSVSEKMADVEALNAVDFRGNHPSFMRTWDDDLEPPSLEIIRKYLSKGFGERLTSGEAAARKLNHTCFMRRSQTSYHSGPHVEQGERCCLDRGARVVHPRRIDHASSIAILAESHTRVEIAVLNFVAAFVAVPLHPAEQPLNCAEVHELEGQGDYAFILWRVLGFRGEANPLVVAAVLAGARFHAGLEQRQPHCGSHQ